MKFCKDCTHRKDRQCKYVDRGGKQFIPKKFIKGNIVSIAETCDKFSQKRK